MSVRLESRNRRELIEPARDWRTCGRLSGRWSTVKPRRTKIIEPMVRLASPDDLPAIVDIYNDAVDDRFATADLRPVSVSDQKPWFEAHDPSSFPIYVFEDQGAVRGWCSLSSYRSGREAVLGTAEISYYVGRRSRNRGVGTALVQSAVLSASQLGKRVLFGILLERNQASIRLMQKCGFELWGRLPDVALIDGVLVSHLYYGRLV